MLATMAFVLAAAVAAPVAAPAETETSLPHRIDVDCRFPHALDRALVRARRLPQVEIVLHGICTGNFAIDREGVTLRGASSGSGLAAPAGTPGSVLAIHDASVDVHGLLVRGGTVGVYVDGSRAVVVLEGVEIVDQDEVGVFAARGAEAHLLGATVRDGAAGVVAASNATLNLQNVQVRNRSIGVALFDRSFGALTDTTVENCLQGGLGASLYSNVNVFGGAFRENGQGHVFADDWSGINLLSGVALGAEGDATSYALSTARQASIACYSTPHIYGDVGAVDDGSIQLGNTVLHGDLLSLQFSKAFVRDATIQGIVVCTDGAQAICRQTTTGGAFDCPSASCGSPPPGTAARASSVRPLPTLRTPWREWLERERSRH